MGLIREIQGLTASMDKRERARRQREQQKTLLYNYNMELVSNLQASIYKYFNDYDILEAEKLLLLNKDDIIAEIVGIMESIKHKEKDKSYYTYRGKFDIVGDLLKIYYSEVQKIKREYKAIKKIEKEEAKQKKADLKELLFDEILKYYKRNPSNLMAVSRTLHDYDVMLELINNISIKKENQDYLKSIYIKTLNEVEKHFKMEIQEEKDAIRYRLQEARQQSIYKTANKVLWAGLLREINRGLTPKKRR